MIPFTSTPVSATVHYKLRVSEMLHCIPSLVDNQEYGTLQQPYALS